MIVGTVALVAATSWVTATWMNQAAGGALRANHDRQATTTALMLAGVLLNDTNCGSDALEATLNDPRVAFTIVADPSGQVVRRHTRDAEAWSMFLRAGTEQRVMLAGLSAPLHLDAAGEVTLRTAPILQRQGPTRLRGYVTVALRDRTLPATLDRLHAVQAGMACAVCLLTIPAVYLAVAHWTQPLRALQEAVQMLASGRRAQRVSTGPQHELASLAHAFNYMAENLFAAHQRLRDANAQLEQKVEQRTAELRLATQRLESELAYKNEFFRTVSHDLGAPLRNISGMAAMLLMKHKTVLAQDAVDKLERIRANVASQVDLLNDLMELSRLRTQKAKREAVDLNALLAQLRESFAFDLDRSRVELVVEPNLPTLHADPNRLRQVFQNLIDNGIKYMMDQPVRRVSVSLLDEETDLHFVVADTGKGIDPKDQPQVFDVFRRAAHSGTHTVPGRGVGLAGVRAILETYNGRVWLKSEPNVGSEFHFTLPKAVVLPTQTAAASLSA